MVSLKRKRASEDSHSSTERYSEEEIDVVNALSRIRPNPQEESNSGEDDLKAFLYGHISKRDAKAGADVLKKTVKRKRMSNQSRSEPGGGSFQSMGLHLSLLRSLTLQGYRIPTPIQRLSIPILLANPTQDLVAMARTGSGKTLAYMIPLVQRLGGRHVNTFGTRALILIPTRELAVQILKVGKELTRGWLSCSGAHAGDKKEDQEKGQGLRWGLVVGGESMDEQFEMMANNPDIIIATPGRLLHLIVEMNLNLKSVQHIIFDEADRLFEMGFEIAMTEIIHRLPPSRQTILFSATLPRSLAEFAKAGLNEPKLVRLDAESKISPDLRMAFFSVKQAEKEACLLALLRDVIKVPFGRTAEIEVKGEDRTKRLGKHAASHQVLVFVATKHHVEFVANLLMTAGYAVSHIYGSLDQAARTFQMDQFRHGATHILVVTDVAARGIDIPVLENVINFDFPQGTRVFVHRVGRTARAGRQGWAWSLVSKAELPYLLDLQLSLGHPLTNTVPEDERGEQVYTESLVLGTFDRTRLDEDIEYIRSLLELNHSLFAQRTVMLRGHIQYERSKGKASPQSHKRAKEMMKYPPWSLADSNSSVHPVLLRGAGSRPNEEAARRALLRSLNSFRPAETVFEAGGKSNANTTLMKQRRIALSKSAEKAGVSPADHKSDVAPFLQGMTEVEIDEDGMNAFGTLKHNFRDPDFYMTHYHQDNFKAAGKEYSLTDNVPFAQQAQRATLDLLGDESALGRQKHRVRWDKKKKSFIKGDGAGANNVKLIKTESGTKLPATYCSGRFEDWKARTKVTLPHVGEAENEFSGHRSGGCWSKRFKHHGVTTIKPLDKLHKNYGRKLRQMKKKESVTQETSLWRSDGKDQKNSIYGEKGVGAVKTELKTAEQIRRARKTMEKKRAKNARPSRNKGRR